MADCRSLRGDMTTNGTRQCYNQVGISTNDTSHVSLSIDILNYSLPGAIVAAAEQSAPVPFGCCATQPAAETDIVMSDIGFSTPCNAVPSLSSMLTMLSWAMSMLPVHMISLYCFMVCLQCLSRSALPSCGWTRVPLTLHQGRLSARHWNCTKTDKQRPLIGKRFEGSLVWLMPVRTQDSGLHNLC